MTEVKDKCLKTLAFFKENKKFSAAILGAFLAFVFGVVNMLDYVGGKIETDTKAINQTSNRAQQSTITEENQDKNAKLEIAPNLPVSNQIVSSNKTVVNRSPENGNLIQINPAIRAFTYEVDIAKEDENMPQECAVTYAKSLSTLKSDLENTSPFDLPTAVYQMSIDGKNIASFSTPDDARAVLDKILDMKVDKTAQLLKVDYKENVNIEKKNMSFMAVDAYSTVDKTVNFLMTGTKEERIYSIVAGDIPETIAESHGMTIEELEAANPQIVGRGHLLQIGEQLSLVVPVPMLNVLTTEKQEYLADIKYETTEEKDPEMYEGESTVKVAGINGEKKVVAEVRRENGVEVDRKIITETVVSEPKGQVLIVGSKPAPPRKGTGVFDVPLSRGYVVSSEFGPRWGGMHTGIDLACSTGSPIIAADGGEVIYSGWDGSYGYTVRIDHGGNYVTTYAHCSELYVVEGEMVFKGQHIADVGSTGRSSGPHIHFEVIKNGTFMNPRNYIFN